MAASDAIAPAAPPSPASDARTRAVAYLAVRHRLHLWEALPWLIAIAAYFLFPDRMVFGSQVLVMVLFAPRIVANILAPGQSPDVQPLTVSLIRIMMLTPFIFSISGLMMGSLCQDADDVLSSAFRCMAAS